MEFSSTPKLYEKYIEYGVQSKLIFSRDFE